MMTLLKWLLIAIAGIAAPIALWWFLAAGHGGVAVGPWRTSLATGGTDADMYTRNYVAITALLALNHNETIYFEAGQDDDGRKLSARCNYDITGGSIQARWWSITAYADDNFLIPNAANRFSYNIRSLPPGPDGSFSIALGPRERQGNWLPTGDRGGGFNLLLRLYNPEAELAKTPGLAKLPSIKRVGEC
jgi:hypothetical protein